MNAALYARISLDALGTEKGVARQLEDARQLAEQRGWTVADQYVDNDVSAFNGDARKAYQRLMADAEAGKFERIVCYMTSRLWRNRAERGQAINRLGRLKIGVAAVRGPELDLSQASGRMLADILGSMDTMESEQLSERVQRAALQRAREGRAHAVVSYGWQRVYEHDTHGRVISWKDIENTAEAAIVREIVNRLLQGEPVRSLVRDFQERGIPTDRGGKWHPTTIRVLATRPANAGLRVYRGEVIGPADWPAIVDPDKHARVVAMFEEPGRRQGSRPGGQKYLLTGNTRIAACGVCGGQLRSTRDTRRPGAEWTYRCERGCTQRNLERVDELVGMVVIQRLSRPDAAGVFDANDGAAQAARERAEGIRARLDNAADEYSEGRIDARQLSRITARLRPELEAAEQEARRSRPVALPAAVEGLLTDRAGAVWASLPVTARRSVLEIIGLKVVINRREKHGAGFEPESVEIKWLQSK